MRKTIDAKWFSIDLEEQWSQFFVGGYNWYSFDVIRLSCEKEYIHGAAEVELYILGLGVRVYWVWDEEMLEEKMKDYQTILSNPDGWVEVK